MSENNQSVNEDIVSANEKEIELLPQDVLEQSKLNKNSKSAHAGDLEGSGKKDEIHIESDKLISPSPLDPSEPEQARSISPKNKESMLNRQAIQVKPPSISSGAINQNAINIININTRPSGRGRRSAAERQAIAQTNDIFASFSDPNIKEITLSNLVAGVSVAFVNLPMCMAFASAAKMQPTAGIISAFWSSLFIFFSDSKYSVISVAMSIALLTGPIVTSYGEDGYHLSLFMCSLIIMFLLFTRIYKYMVIIPKCVMDGFLAGCCLGVFAEQMETIFTIELHPKAVIGEKPQEEMMLKQLVNGVTQVVLQSSKINWLSVIVYFSVTISLYLLMKKYPSKPWVLFMCIFGIVIGFAEDFIRPGDYTLIRLSEKYPNLSLKFFQFPQIGLRKMSTLLSNPQFYFDTISMAIVILLEGMITWGMMSVKSDQSYSSKPKNILVIIFANLSCIVTGSMGSSFVYARSLLNYLNGSKNQISCVLNGLICLGIGFLFFNFFSKMPSVVLEAILMGLELKTIRIPEMIFAFKHDFKFFLTNISVIISMLFTRMSNAILVGLFVYLAMFTKELMIPQNEVSFTKRGDGFNQGAYLEDSSKKNWRRNLEKIRFSEFWQNFIFYQNGFQSKMFLMALGSIVSFIALVFPFL